MRRGSKEYDIRTVRSPVPSALGFLVTSASFRLLAANQEAVTILTYPRRRRAQSVTMRFDKKLRQRLVRALSSRSRAYAIRLKSGRRTYFCRTFVLDGHATAPDAASMLVILERGDRITPTDSKR